MAHEITDTDSAAFALTPAWHGLGTVLDHVPTSGEMRDVSGLTWEPIPCPVLADAPSPFDGRPAPSMGLWTLDGATPVPERVALRRSDSGDVLGIVSEGYGIVPNRALFDMLDGLADDLGDPVTFESAFSMQGGRRVAVVARLPGPDLEVAPGDSVRRYVLAQTSHDGSASVDLCPTTVRVVCANTVSAGLAEADRKGERFRIRHTVNALDRLAAARDIIRDAVRLWDGDVALARSMARVRLDDDTVRAFLARVVPVAEGASATVRNRAERIRADILDRFQNGALQGAQGGDLASIRGTAWAAFNAVTEYVDHGDASHLRGDPGSRERAESRYLRDMEGSGADLKASAWRAAVALA